MPTRTSRTTRTTSDRRPHRSLRRPPVPRSKSSQALNGLAGLLPGSVLGRAAKPAAATRGRSRAGKLALMVGAAGLVLKNRDKLPGPLGRNGRAESIPPQTAIEPDPLAPSAPERQPIAT